MQNYLFSLKVQIIVNKCQNFTKYTNILIKSYLFFTDKKPLKI